MDAEKFRSRLGEVAVTDSHIERKRKDTEEWRKIEEKFSDRKIIDEIHFSKVEEIELATNSVYPNIKIRQDGSWKRMFFHIGDPVQEIYSELEKRFNAYKQAYQ
ncbi:MAG: hypothetical protein ABEJ93_00170 [Candidatus Nanohalobium sp.]